MAVKKKKAAKKVSKKKTAKKKAVTKKKTAKRAAGKKSAKKKVAKKASAKKASAKKATKKKASKVAKKTTKKSAKKTTAKKAVKKKAAKKKVTKKTTKKKTAKKAKATKKKAAKKSTSTKKKTTKKATAKKAVKKKATKKKATPKKKVTKKKSPAKKSVAKKTTKKKASKKKTVKKAAPKAKKTAKKTSKRKASTKKKVQKKAARKQGVLKQKSLIPETPVLLPTHIPENDFVASWFQSDVLLKAFRELGLVTIGDLRTSFEEEIVAVANESALVELRAEIERIQDQAFTERSAQAPTENIKSDLVGHAHFLRVGRVQSDGSEVHSRYHVCEIVHHPSSERVMVRLGIKLGKTWQDIEVDKKRVTMLERGVRKGQLEGLTPLALSSLLTDYQLASEEDKSIVETILEFEFGQFERQLWH